MEVIYGAEQQPKTQSNASAESLPARAFPWIGSTIQPKRFWKRHERRGMLACNQEKQKPRQAFAFLPGLRVN
jgi:hypothetical protein